MSVCGAAPCTSHGDSYAMFSFVPVIYSGYRTVCTPSPRKVSAPRKRSRRFTSVRVGQIPCARAHGLPLMGFCPPSRYKKEKYKKKYKPLSRSACRDEQLWSEGSAARLACYGEAMTCAIQHSIM
ncbi:hypothetical protein EVAR_4504_1 [Eumeta japonica]|uniref:Uncharacterized protein n=1 Tax=Eumeta variegata TaxID=151549 RepID=A0A4C1SY24_EUMVA|nr:hypothetical protein EVAR_4504_1 [Eumeta japonica]